MTFKPLFNKNIDLFVMVHIHIYCNKHLEHSAKLLFFIFHSGKKVIDFLKDLRVNKHGQNSNILGELKVRLSVHIVFVQCLYTCLLLFILLFCFYFP